MAEYILCLLVVVCFIILAIASGVLSIYLFKNFEGIIEFISAIFFAFISVSIITIGTLAVVEGDDYYHIVLRDNENSIIKDTTYTYKDYIIRENGCITFKNDPKKYCGFILEETKIKKNNE